MNNRDQFVELIRAQEKIRLVIKHRREGVFHSWLEEIDLELGKLINGLGGTLETIEDN